MSQIKFMNKSIYHVFNKSIANFNIFKLHTSYTRFIASLSYYNTIEIKTPLSFYLRKHSLESIPIPLYKTTTPIVKILAYCVMPDHYHILLKVIKEELVSQYLSDIQNAYSRFLNLAIDRKGPLWQSRFKSVLIHSEEQLLHITRYIHLNPSSSNLVNNPSEWLYSSYTQYLNKKILDKYLVEIPTRYPAAYKKFVEDQIEYQKKLKEIRKLKLD